MLGESVLVDTGPLVAIYNAKDPHHAACVEQLKTLPAGKAYTCWPVLTEAAYLLRRYPKQRDDLLQAVLNGEFSILNVWADDLVGIQDVFDKYHDQQVDLADAVLVHLADREGIEAVFTLDHRHFGIFRKQNGKEFHVLPESVA